MAGIGGTSPKPLPWPVATDNGSGGGAGGAPSGAALEQLYVMELAIARSAMTGLGSGAAELYWEVCRQKQNNESQPRANEPTTLALMQQNESHLSWGTTSGHIII